MTHDLRRWMQLVETAAMLSEAEPWIAFFDPAVVEIIHRKSGS